MFSSAHLWTAVWVGTTSQSTVKGRSELEQSDPCTKWGETKRQELREWWNSMYMWVVVPTHEWHQGLCVPAALVPNLASPTWALIFVSAKAPSWTVTSHRLQLLSDMNFLWPLYQLCNNVKAFTVSLLKSECQPFSEDYLGGCCAGGTESTPPNSIHTQRFSPLQRVPSTLAMSFDSDHMLIPTLKGEGLKNRRRKWG